jgi:hypothetical protein
MLRLDKRVQETVAKTIVQMEIIVEKSDLSHFAATNLVLIMNIVIIKIHMTV